MTFQEQTTLSSIDWRFIEEYLPRYYSREDVLLSDILLRYLENEDITEEDSRIIEECFHADKQKVLLQLTELENKLMTEAMGNYEQKNQMPYKKLDPVT